MRNSNHHLKDNHILWGLKIVPRRKVRLGPSTQLRTIPPDQTNLPRFEVVQQPQQNESPSPSTSIPTEGPIQVVEILPRRPYPTWNTGQQQDFSLGNTWQELNAVEHALRLLPPDPGEGRVERLTSPFEDFQLSINHPENLNFQPGVHSRCELLFETPNPEYAENYETAALPGPSHRPATPPFKRHVLYRYNRTSILPVPDHYAPGTVRKVNYTKFTPDQEAHFFDLDRKNRAVDIIKAKQIFEAFRNQSIALGNQYYLEWEARQVDLQKDIHDSYKWDMHTQEYFSALNDFETGKSYFRPKPILLIGESVTNLLRSGAETPIEDYETDPMDDETFFPDPPDPPLPFWAKRVRPPLWTLRKRGGPSFVPGGFLYHLTDVRETGEVFCVQEMEFAPITREEFQPPRLDSPGSPIQEGVMSGIFTDVFTPPPECTIFEDQGNEREMTWPDDHRFLYERKHDLGQGQGQGQSQGQEEDVNDLDFARMNLNPSDIMAEELAWGRRISDDFFITAFGQVLFAQAYPEMSSSYREICLNRWKEPYGRNEEYTYNPREREIMAPRRINPYRGLGNRRDWYY